MKPTDISRFETFLLDCRLAWSSFCYDPDGERALKRLNESQRWDSEHLFMIGYAHRIFEDSNSSEYSMVFRHNWAWRHYFKRAVCDGHPDAPCWPYTDMKQLAEGQCFFRQGYDAAERHIAAEAKFAQEAEEDE